MGLYPRYMERQWMADAQRRVIEVHIDDPRFQPVLRQVLKATWLATTVMPSHHRHA